MFPTQANILDHMRRIFTIVLKTSSRLFSKLSGHGSARHWYPTRFLAEDEIGANIALVILNSRPITDDPDRQLIKNLWPKAKVHVCADGGTNKVAAANREEGTSYCPDIICGDLDSARTEYVNEFKERGCIIHQDKSQDSTDFTKCLRVLANQLKDIGHKTKIDTIVTIGGLHGRFDHVIGCIHSLFLLQKEHPLLSVYLVQYPSSITLLPPGSHVIHVDDRISTGVCGLAPIGQPVEGVTTTGLEWNLNNETLAFGTLVSTSNQVNAPEVHIQTNGPLLWILNLRTQHTYVADSP